MSDKATLDKMREDLKVLHSSNLPADEKDMKARKLRRQIRALAEKLGEPRTARSGEPREKKDRGARKSGSAIDLSQVQVYTQAGEEVGENGAVSMKSLSKAEKRKLRREMRKQKDQGSGGVKYRRGYLPHSEVDPSEAPAIQFIKEIRQRLIDWPLTVVADGEKRTGYGCGIDTWPAILQDGQKPQDLAEAQRKLLAGMIEKFQARVKKMPEWFFILRQGTGLIVALGPVGPELEHLKSKRPQYSEEDEVD